MTSNSQAIQDEQYAFPYHHIPFRKHDGTGIRVRKLNWGFEYLLCLERLVQIISLEESASSILDIGCGDGVFLASLPESLPDKVGVDTNERAIAFAKAFSPEIDFRCQSSESVVEKFDIVSAIEVMEHIPDAMLGPFLTQAARLLKPGGLLLLSVPTVNEPLNPKHFRHYDSELLISQTKEPLRELKLERLEYFFASSILERIYRRLTENPLIYGEIPALRRLVYQHLRRRSMKASSKTGKHLIASFRMPTS